MSDRTKLWLKIAGLFLLAGLLFGLVQLITKSGYDLFKTAVNSPPSNA